MHADVSSDDVKIRVGGIGEQHQSERQLCQQAQAPGAEIQTDETETEWPEQQTRRREQDRPAEPRPLDPTGDRTVDKQKNGQDRGILVHRTITR